MKKRYIRRFLILGLFCGLLSMNSSCKTGEGCGNEQKYSPKTDKKGNLSTKRGKSNLFSKKQRKR